MAQECDQSWMAVPTTVRIAGTVGPRPIPVVARHLRYMGSELRCPRSGGRVRRFLGASCSRLPPHRRSNQSIFEPTLGKGYLTDLATSWGEPLCPKKIVGHLFEFLLRHVDLLVGECLLMSRQGFEERGLTLEQKHKSVKYELYKTSYLAQDKPKYCIHNTEQLSYYPSEQAS